MIYQITMSYDEVISKELEELETVKQEAAEFVSRISETSQSSVFKKHILESVCPFFVLLNFKLEKSGVNFESFKTEPIHYESLFNSYDFQSLSQLDEVCGKLSNLQAELKEIQRFFDEYFAKRGIEFADDYGKVIPAEYKELEESLEKLENILDEYDSEELKESIKKTEKCLLEFQEGQKELRDKIKELKDEMKELTELEEIEKLRKKEIEILKRLKVVNENCDKKKEKLDEFNEELERVKEIEYNIRTVEKQIESFGDENDSENRKFYPLFEDLIEHMELEVLCETCSLESNVGDIVDNLDDIFLLIKELQLKIKKSVSFIKTELHPMVDADQVFELISSDNTAFERINHLLDAHILKNYEDTESLMSYLKKFEKKNILNI